MPIGVPIKDPRTMKLDSLISFFKHISDREEHHGLKQAFKFKAVLSSRKKGSLRRASYEDDGDQPEEAVAQQKRRRRRKPRPQVDLENTLLNDTIASLPGTSQPNDPRRIQSIANNDQDSAIVPTGLFTPGESPAPGNDTLSPSNTRNETLSPGHVRNHSLTPGRNISLPRPSTGIKSPAKKLKGKKRR